MNIQKIEIAFNKFTSRFKKVQGEDLNCSNIAHKILLLGFIKRTVIPFVLKEVNEKKRVDWVKMRQELVEVWRATTHWQEIENILDKNEENFR